MAATPLPLRPAFIAKSIYYIHWQFLAHLLLFWNILSFYYYISDIFTSNLPSATWPTTERGWEATTGTAILPHPGAGTLSTTKRRPFQSGGSMKITTKKIAGTLLAGVLLLPLSAPAAETDLQQRVDALSKE